MEAELMAKRVRLAMIFSSVQISAQYRYSSLYVDARITLNQAYWLKNLAEIGDATDKRQHISDVLYYLENEVK